MAVGLPVVRACELAEEPAEAQWLVRHVWVRHGVGIIGGQPKLGKSWLGLDLAISVASGTPCLGHFAVEESGPALVYLAEDGLGAVRGRIDAICAHRRLALSRLDLHVITAPVVRLDIDEHCERLTATIEALRPRLIVLDPLVRLHRLDENSSLDISRLLGFLRELQRTFDVSIALVHHASKKRRGRPGQALRGSSDLHAFIDSLAYLDRSGDELQLHLEHRSAPSLDPIPIRLTSKADGLDTHLELVAPPPVEAPVIPLTERVLDVLRVVDGPMRRQDLRERLRINNQRLGDALSHLERDGRVSRGDVGWTIGTKSAQVALL